MTAKPIPEGHHSLSPNLTVDNGLEALTFYENGFGAEVPRKLVTAGYAPVYGETPLDRRGDGARARRARRDSRRPLIFASLRLRARGSELRLFSTIATFGTALDITVAELAIESFFPADPDTEQALRGAFG